MQSASTARITTPLDARIDTTEMADSDVAVSVATTTAWRPRAKARATAASGDAMVSVISYIRIGDFTTAVGMEPLSSTTQTTLPQCVEAAVAAAQPQQAAVQQQAAAPPLVQDGTWV